jgi:serine/threonine-protein kinase
VARYATHAALALAHAHERGVVHRDIKPSNLIVTKEAQLKVADFGVARIDTSNLTTAGMVIGTPSYMSPEQCRGLETDARSDLFSAGVVLYELLTGVKPFRGNVQAIAYKICHEEPEPPSALSSLKLPPAVDQLVAKAMAKDPAARFQDARTFHAALRDVGQMSVEVDTGLGTTMVAIGTLLLQKPEQAAWDDDTLRTAEQELARAVGPMARLIVRRAAAQTSDRAELCSILSDNITDPESRRRFVDAFNKTGSGVHAGTTGSHGAHGAHGALASSPSGHGRVATSMPTSMPGTMQPVGMTAAGAPLEQAFVDQIAGRLAVYLGPIAPIVTRKAARDAKTRSEFVRRVADSLGTQERAAFLREVGYGDS